MRPRLREAYPMKKLLLTSAVLAFASKALAADVDAPPLYPPVPPPPPPYFWTACHIGGQAGFGFKGTEFSDPTGANFAFAGTTATDSNGGSLAGGQLGCDFQLYGNWVIGVEAALAWADFQHQTTTPFFFGPTSLFAKTDEIGSVTARVGYAWDRLLFFAKGGVAFAHNQYAVNVAPFGPALSFNGSGDLGGLLIGAGVEWAFLANWSAKVEMDYYDLVTGNQNLSSVGGTIPVTVKEHLLTISAGINYRLGVASSSFY